MQDIIDIAISQIGYCESSNKTKYGEWYGMNGAPWCHMFVSWCANKANISSLIIPKTASTTSGMQWFKDKGLFKDKNSYTPKRGDLIYFKTGASHVGIVEKVSGSTVHTIEGNTSNKVARRSYQFSHKTITGYGVPEYENKMVHSENKNSDSENKNSKELEYLKKLISAKKVNVKDDNLYKEKIGKQEKIIVDILMQNGKIKFWIPVLDDLQIVWERVGTPGKLTFKTQITNSKFVIQEGISALVYINKKKFFYGYIFTIQQSKDGILSLTAYDQLRYLKNKDTYVYANKTASELIKTIANDYKLGIGTIVDTQYKMSRIEENITLFDALQNALDETSSFKNKIYVLYDDVGKLTLKDIKTMKINCLIDEVTGEDYTFKSSIDSNVYNQIKLVYENKEKGTLDIYLVKDQKLINDWGLLQYFEKIDNPDIGKSKANVLSKMYGKKRRSLSITDAFGNISVRAGTLIPVILDLGEIKVKNYMLVEKVIHKFSNNSHSMNLSLTGGEFNE